MKPLGKLAQSELKATGRKKENTCSENETWIALQFCVSPEYSEMVDSGIWAAYITPVGQSHLLICTKQLGRIYSAYPK